MSWNDYIDNLIAQSRDSFGNPHVDRACVIGLDGSKLTTDDHPNALKVTSEEAYKISRAFKEKDISTFMIGMFHAERQCYTFREMDKIMILDNLKSYDALMLQCTKAAIVIGHSAEGSQQGKVNAAVGVVAEHLESLGM